VGQSVSAPVNCADMRGIPGFKTHAPSHGISSNPRSAKVRLGCRKKRAGHHPMVSKYTPLKDRLSAADEVDKEWSTLTLYRDIALGGAAVLLAFGGAIQSFLVNVLQHKDFSSIGEVIVKLFFVVLFFLWYQSGNEEYKILKKWVRTPTLRPQKPIIIMFLIIGLGVFFGLLTTFAAKIHVVFLMFCLYLMGDIYSWILRRGEIGGAIEGGS